MNKVSNVIDYSLILVASSIGVDNIKSWLGVAILIIQLIWLICKCVVLIVNKVKKGEEINETDFNTGEIANAVDKIVDRIDNISEVNNARKQNTDKQK